MLLSTALFAAFCAASVSAQAGGPGPAMQGLPESGPSLQNLPSGSSITPGISANQMTPDLSALKGLKKGQQQAHTEQPHGLLPAGLRREATLAGLPLPDPPSMLTQKGSNQYMQGIGKAFDGGLGKSNMDAIRNLGVPLRRQDTPNEVVTPAQNAPVQNPATPQDAPMQNTGISLPPVPQRLSAGSALDYVHSWKEAIGNASPDKKSVLDDFTYVGGLVKKEVTGLSLPPPPADYSRKSVNAYTQALQDTINAAYTIRPSQQGGGPLSSLTNALHGKRQNSNTATLSTEGQKFASSLFPKASDPTQAYADFDYSLQRFIIEANMGHGPNEVANALPLPPTSASTPAPSPTSSSSSAKPSGSGKPSVKPAGPLGALSGLGLRSSVGSPNGDPSTEFSGPWASFYTFLQGLYGHINNVNHLHPRDDEVSIERPSTRIGIPVQSPEQKKRHESVRFERRRSHHHRERAAQQAAKAPPKAAFAYPSAQDAPSIQPLVRTTQNILGVLKKNKADMPQSIAMLAQ